MAKEIDPDVARFAAYVRDQEQREKAAKRAERQARQEAETAKALVAAKDAAAAEVKRLRGRPDASAEERAAADAAYREALAAVVAAETGEAPAWAPPPAAEPHPGTGPDPDPEAEIDPEAETDPETDPETETETETEAGPATDDEVPGS